MLLYGYVDNNPLTLVDPTGLSTEDFYEAMMKAKGAAAQALVSSMYEAASHSPDGVIADLSHSDQVSDDLETALAGRPGGNGAAPMDNLETYRTRNDISYGADWGILGPSELAHLANNLEGQIEWAARGEELGRDMALTLATFAVPIPGASWLSKWVAGKVAQVVATKAASSEAINVGGNIVYRSVNAAGEVQYVGITNNFARRAAEHLASKGIRIQKVMEGLSRSDARAVEQALIELHGLMKNGGTLLNKINSIARTNPTYAQQLARGIELLTTAGY